MRNLAIASAIFFVVSILVAAQPVQAFWATNGVGICTATGNQQDHATITSDGAGGAIITWYDYRNGNADIFAQRVDVSGAAQWTANGVAICTASQHQSDPTITSDGAGGAIITWRDYRSDTYGDIYAQRVNSSGAVQWTAGGVAICTAANHQYYPHIISDGMGGAVIAWGDRRNGDWDTYAQRVNASGTVQWTANGVALCTATGEQDYFVPQIASDGAAGAFVTWQDYRNGNYDIYAQRVNASGAVNWAANGVALCAATGNQQSPAIASDGIGGAVVTWQDYRGGNADIFAQRINALGAVQWAADGVPLCAATGDQLYPAITLDGTGGAFVTWQDYRSGNYDIYAQRVDAWGAPQWTANGVALCAATQNQQTPAIASDGTLGAFVIWQDYRGSSADIFAQRINAYGAVQWAANGIPLCAATGDQWYPAIASSGAGRAIIAWDDYRSGSNYAVYAQELAPPALVKAIAKSPSRVDVTFDETVEAASAQTVANYQIFKTADGSSIVAITGATLLSDQKSVSLTLAVAPDPEVEYTLRAQNIKGSDGVMMPSAGEIGIIFVYPPVIQWVSGLYDGQQVVVDTVLFAWSSYDTTSPSQHLYRYSLDGGSQSAWAPDTFTVLRRLSDGLHTFTVWTQDGFGNTSSIAARFAVYPYGHGMLTLFADPAGTDCDLEIATDEIKDLYLFYVRGTGPTLGSAVEFRLRRSSSNITFQDPEWSSDIITSMGDVYTGISLVGSKCLGKSPSGEVLDKVYLGRIPIYNAGGTDASYVRVVDDPNASPPGTYVVACDAYNTLVEVFGGAVTVNGTCGVGGVTAAAPTRARVDLTFSQLLDSQSASTLSNYSIFKTSDSTKVVRVSSAVLLTNLTTVRLTLADSLEKTVPYTVKLGSILGINGQPVAPGAHIPVGSKFPGISITTGPSEGQHVASQNVKFSWRGTSALTPAASLLYSYRLDGNAQSAWTNDTTVTIAGIVETSHYFIVWVKDQNGTTEEAHRHFIVDVTPPVYTLDASPGASSHGYVNSTSVSVLGEAHDNITPSDTIYTSARLDDGAWTAWRKQPKGDPTDGYSFSGLSIATPHTISLRARDLAGNIGSVTSDSYIVDVIPPETRLTSHQSKYLHDVWSSSSTDAFAVGESGTILHYDGSSWSTMTSGTNRALEGIWAASASDLFAVGSNGAILRYNATTWDSMASGTSAHLYAVWGTSGSNVYAVGWGGTILHFDGTSWSSMASGTTMPLYGIWGSSATDIFAVGTHGTILHYSGAAWSAMASGTEKPLFEVWGAASSNVYVVGMDQTMLRYNGSAWSNQSGNPSSSGLDYTDVWGSSANDIYVVEQSLYNYDPDVTLQRSRLIHFNGSTWSDRPLNTNALIEAIHGSSASDMHVVGMTNTILHYGSSNGKRILLYATRGTGAGNGSRRYHYDEDLPAALAQDGFSVACHDRESMPALTPSILGGYDQLWLISTETATTLSTAELQAIQNFHSAGKGIMIVGDSDPYNGPANAVSSGWHVSIGSTANRCGGPIGCPISTAGFTSHAFWSGVSTIQGNLNEGVVTASSPAQVIATSGSNMVAVYNVAGEGRVAWDATWYRFSDATCHADLSIAYYDNARYARNIALWLYGSGSSWSVARDWRTGGEIYGSGASPVTITMTGMDDLTPDSSLSYNRRLTDYGWSVSSGPGSATIPLTSVPEGAHAVTSQATDYADNRDAVPSVFSFLVDRTAPVATIISGPGEGQRILTRTVQMCWGATDNLVPLDQLLFAYSLDGGAQSDWTPWQSAHCASYSDLSFGNHTFKLWAKDLSGNTATLERMFHIDEATKHDPLANGSDPYYLWRENLVLWTASENGYLTGPVPASASWSSAIVSRRKFGSDGNPYMVARILHTSSSNHMFGFGDTDPNTTDFTYGNIDFGLYIHSSGTLRPSWATSTPISGSPTLPAGIYDFMIYLDKARGKVGFSIEKVASYDAPLSDFIAPVWSTETAKTLSSSIYYIQNNPYSNAGRVYDIWTSRDTTDVVPPETQIVTGPLDGSVVDTSIVSFTWTGTDNLTPTAQLVYAWRLDGGAYSALAAATSRTLTGLTDGPHTFEVYARDYYLNDDPTPAARSFTADVTAPSISILQGPTNGQQLTTTETTVSWSATDLISPAEAIRFSYRLDGAAYSPWDTTRSVTFTSLSEGSHVVTIRARDQVGHAGSTQRSFFVDLTPPETEIVTGPQDGGWSPAAITVTWRGTDNISHADSIRFSHSLDAEPWSRWSWDKSRTLSGLADGEHVFRVRSMDLARHVDQTPDSTSFTVVSTATAVAGPITGSTTWTKANSPYIVTADVTIRGAEANALAILSIEPGVEVRFYPGAGLFVGERIGGAAYLGLILAPGTDAEPIVFTSNSLTPSPGNWKGIYFRDPGVGGSLSHCAVRYGGETYGANIYCAGAAAGLEYLEISHSSGWGIITSETAAAVHNSSFFDNQAGGAQNSSAAYTLDAIYNWWGSSSGPSGAGPGTGQAVGQYVLYDPWFLRQPASDAAPPVVSFTVGPNNLEYVSSPLVTFEWSGSDDVTPPDSLVYSRSLDDAAFSPWSPDTMIQLNLSEGFHFFHVRARDLVGRISDTASRFFIYDVTAPDAQITAGPPDGGWIRSTSAVFEWTGTDNATSPDNLQFSYRMDLDPWSAYATTKSASYVTLSEGPHLFVVMAKDQAGLEDATPDTLQFSVDVTPPETEIASGPPEGSTISAASAIFTWRGTDNRTPSPQLLFAYRLDGGDYSAFSSDTAYTFASLADGSHDVFVKSRDLALNEDATPAHRSFIVDRTPPAIAFTAGPSDGRHLSEASAQFCWAGTDQYTPVSAIEYAYRMDGEPRTAWTRDSCLTLSSLPEGAHLLEAWARDSLGNEGHADRHFTIDLTKPVVAVTAGPKDGGWSPPDVAFSWAGTDNLAPSDSLWFSYRLDEGAWSAFARVTTHPYTALSVAGHTFLVRVKDLAGNVGDSVAVHFSVDGVPPETEIAAGPVENEIVSPAQGSLLFSWTGIDDHSPADSIRFAYRLDAAAWSAFRLDRSTSVDLNISNGMHTFAVKARDLAANEDATPAARHFIVDGSAPVLSFTSGPSANQHLASADVSICWAATDNQSPIDSIAYSVQLDAAGFGPWTGDSCASFASLPQGNHTVTARARDEAGNMGIAQRSFTVDLTPPAVTITGGPAAGSFANAAVTYTWSGTDNLTAAGSLTFSCRMDANPWSAFSTNKTATFSSLSDGSHTFKLRARDLAGNTSDSTVVDFEVDLVPPETWIVSGPAAGSRVDTTIARFSWRGSDDASPVTELRFSYKLDGGAFSSFSKDTSVTFANLGDGSHTFVVKARDLALNEDPTPESRSFITDARGPVITFTIAPSAGQHIAAAEADFVWTGSDLISPPEVLTYSYRIDGQAYSAWSSAAAVTVSNLSEGVHTFDVRGRDDLGNIGSASRSFTVDRTPPTMQVASGPAAGSCWPQTSATFGWSGQDNYSTPSNLQYAVSMDGETYSSWAAGTGKSYTNLSHGSHVFHVKAKDKAGNESAYPTDVAFAVGSNDLVVTDIGVPGSAYCNHVATISWTVVNQGTCPVTGTWNDRVSISADSLAGSDTQIGTYQRSSTLEAGQSYTMTEDIVLPDNINGRFWIVIMADGGGAIVEEGAEGNNTGLSSGVQISIPPHPDLQVTGITAPAEGYAGRGVYVEWTVANRGIDAARGPWKEYVYISSDASPGSDTKLSEFNYDYALEVDSSYTHSHPVTFPADVSGDFWIVVCTDATNKVSEYEWESNNCAVSLQPVHIDPTPYPNLVVTSVMIPPDSMSSNDEIEISWVVTNTGDEATNAPVWYDRVYLSPTQAPGGTVIGEFENMSYLQPGASYPHTNQKVKIPKQTTNGVYYIVVVTDSRGNVSEHNNENDNSRASVAMPVRYVPYPRPDLAVTSFISSLSGWAGNTIRLTYRVSNIGNEAASGYQINDWVWLSPDSIIDPHHHQHIGAGITGESLAPATGYDRTVDIVLPNGISGKHYLYIWTDVDLKYDDPDLDNNFSTIRPIMISIPPTPDLVVSHLSTTTATVQAGTNLGVEWTVSNEGAGPGYVTAWRDAIYLSDDEVLNTASDERLLKLYRSGILEPGSPYTKSYSVPIPAGITGTKYIFAYTDIDNEVPEGTYENNNASEYAIEINVTPPPVVQLPESDLRVPSIWSDQAVWSGSTVAVSWTAKNLGPDDVTVSSWIDRVYLSTDSTLSTGTDALMLSLSHAGPLPVNATYSVTQNVAIPNGLEGDFYMFVQTDATEKVNEPNHENDNVGRTSLLIRLTPPPDLVVSELITPAESLLAGQSGAVQWTVRNGGAGSTVSSAWVDKLYLSADSVLNISTDKYLQSFAHTGAVDAGHFYQQNRSVLIPTGYAGAYYLIACTDADGQVYEHTAEQNNARPALLRIAAPPEIPPPNLVIDGFDFIDGLKDTVQFTVRNGGVSSIPSAQRGWTDRIYLSTDAVLNTATDPVILTFNRAGDLAPGASYSVTREVILPNGTAGVIYLFAVIDATGKVTETNETDNVLTHTRTIELTYADLKVSSVRGLTTISAGQSGRVSWSVENLGNGLPEPGTWYDGVYLSRDRILDETDYALGSSYHQGSLVIGALYRDSLLVTIPSGLSGTYYFFVKTDRSNAVYEHNREDNNTAYGAGGVAVYIPPADADLVISGIVPPTSTVSGDTVSISWTITNESSVALSGQWRDAVYVSSDTIWDLSDGYLGEVPFTAGLGPGARYVHSLDILSIDYLSMLEATVPGLVPGSYYIIVRADIRNNVVENDESNNEGHSTAGMPVDVRELAMGSMQSSRIRPRERQYFKLQAPPGTDIRFYTTCGGTYDELELYVRFGAVPDRISYDYVERISASQQVIVPGSQETYCYIMIYGDYVPGSGNYSIRAESFLFELSKVEPSTLDNSGIATLNITGGRLGDVTSAALRNHVGEALEALDLHALNSTSLEASFDLRNVEFGAYDLVVSTATADTATLLSGVSIIPGQGADVRPDIKGADAVRQSVSADYTVVLENFGTADAYDVLSALIMSSGTNYQLMIDNTTTEARTCAGETVLVHTNRIGVGQSIQYTVRLWGRSRFDVQVLSVQGVPTLVPISGGTAIISEFVSDCADAFVDHLQQDGIAIDTAQFNTAYAGEWAGTWARGRSALIEDKITETTFSALGALNEPIGGDDVIGVTTPAIEASLTVVDAYLRAAVLANNYKKRLKDVTVRVARDPNEKYGPAEAGGEGIISQVDNIPFTVYFENMPDASAAARQVVVSDYLDANFDWRRFRLGEIAFGDRIITVPPNRSYYHTTIPLDSIGMLLEIDAGINTTTGEARWLFTTIDPGTGLPPIDPNAGFLPPNDSTGIGQGHVFFTIRTDPDVPDGATIKNRALIVFDLNTPIETNEVEIYVNREYPDLEITSAAGRSAYSSFVEGEPITIEAIISNQSAASVPSFKVAFFDGDPDAGGTLIGSPQSVTGIASGSQTLVDVTWIPLRTLDQHAIYIRADLDEEIAESDETNNTRILVLGAQPKTYTARLAKGINLISLPLEPLESHSARSLAALAAATQIIRYDTAGTGAFESFVLEQSGDGFPIRPGEGYIAVLPNAGSATFTGITNTGALSVKAGLNLLSLPLDPGSPCTARSYCQQLGGNMLIRYSHTKACFEAFIPEFHSGGGFDVLAARSYLLAADTSRTVTLNGSGWMGAESGAPPELAASSQEQGNGATAVLGVTGTLYTEHWGRKEPIMSGCTAIARIPGSGLQASIKIDDATGEFTGAFVDLSGGAGMRSGDKIQISVKGPDGLPLGEPIGYTITKDDVMRCYVRFEAIASEATPSVTRLYQNFPNPFNPTTSVRYQLSKPGPVSLRVYTVVGQLVKTLIDEPQQPGYFQATWDGRNTIGTQVASGVYFYRLETPDYSKSFKMVILR